MPEANDDILHQLQRFLTAQPNVAAPPRIEGVERVGVGRSRENWLFDAVWPNGTVEPLIVRRDPPGGLLETSRATEFAVLRALEATSVPAPRVRWLDADGSELGRPSLVMVREPGEVDYFVVNGDRPLAERVDLAQRFCDLLATLHTADWAAAGLGAVLQDPGPEAARAELDGWTTILRRDQLEPWPELEVARRWLAAAAPRSGRTVVVHGDFKPGNVLVDDGDRLVALLDWELAHLGDPMEDLGWITQPLRLREHLIPGAWERADLFARYEAATGIPVDPDAVAWWNVLASYKTAVMQISGLRSFREGRSDEPYRPTAAVLRTLLDAVAPPQPESADASLLAAGGAEDHIVSQHLAGARRLLERVAADPGLSPASTAVVADVRRLLRQAATAWPDALAFLVHDNQRLAELLAGLGIATGTYSDDLSGGGVRVDPAHRRNVELRGRLADAADSLNGGQVATAARALRRRLDRDP
ncbi:MAG: phosphotransferase family protein, partial [Acidimicrobiia bacterium]|nr:phosphotransferase family protein [Acidimicrobiia bacterium]